MTCFLCAVPAHGVCIKENSINPTHGIVYLCAACVNNKGKSDVIITDDTGKPQQSPTDTEDSSDSGEETKPNKEKKKSYKHKKPKNRSGSDSSDSDSDNTPDDQPYEGNQKMCSFFKRGTCKYGASGRSGGTCRFIHRQVCTAYRLHGETRKGCKKKDKCKYWHPPLCYNSVNYRECLNDKCRFWHLKGTSRPRDDQETQEMQQQPGMLPASTTTAPLNNSDFLSQMRVQMNSEITLMRQQQQQLMQQMNHQFQKMLNTFQQVQQPQAYMQARIQHPSQNYAQTAPHQYQ